MAEGARIDSIDVLQALKVAIWKFQEAAEVALGDAESEMGRVVNWLHHEQDSYWQHQIRKREEIVGRCKEAVRMKKIFKDATGRQQSAIDEERALKIAQRSFEEAQQKLVAVRKWARQLPKEIELYKGSVQRFSTTVQSDLPNAAAYLEKLSRSLNAYLAVQAGGASDLSAAGSAEGNASMSRGGVAQSGIAPDELDRLMAQLPDAETRAAAPMMAELRLPIPIIPPDQHAPQMLPVTARTPLSLDSRIVIAKGAEQASKLFLHHHSERLTTRDAGWSVMPVEGATEGQWEAVRAGDLLAQRPDLADLLGLPVGFSVMIDSSGISNVIDVRLLPAWRRG
jgi:hypothetical protein